MRQWFFFSLSTHTHNIQPPPAKHRSHNKSERMKAMTESIKAASIRSTFARFIEVDYWISQRWACLLFSSMYLALLSIKLHVMVKREAQCTQELVNYYSVKCFISLIEKGTKSISGACCFTSASNRNPIRVSSAQIAGVDNRSRCDRGSRRQTCTASIASRGWSDPSWKKLDKSNVTFLLHSLKRFTSLSWWSRKSGRSRHKTDGECSRVSGSSCALYIRTVRLILGCHNKSAWCREFRGGPWEDFRRQ